MGRIKILGQTPLKMVRVQIDLSDQKLSVFSKNGKASKGLFEHPRIYMEGDGTALIYAFEEDQDLQGCFTRCLLYLEDIHEIN